MSHPGRTVGTVTEHLYEARCVCGAAWRVLLEEDDDPMATCMNCGDDCFDLTDLGADRTPAANVND